MAAPGAHGAILEQHQRERIRRIGLIAGGGVLLVLLLLLALRSRPDRVAGHAFAIPSGEDRLTAEVFNGTNRAGLARAATRELRRAGIDVVLFGNAEAPADSTRLLVRRGRPGAAERVREALATGVVETRIDSLRRVDVTVILGPDYRPPAGFHP